jgi:hypothetical protein
MYTGSLAMKIFYTIIGFVIGGFFGLIAGVAWLIVLFSMPTGFYTYETYTHYMGLGVGIYTLVVFTWRFVVHMNGTPTQYEGIATRNRVTAVALLVIPGLFLLIPIVAGHDSTALPTNGQMVKAFWGNRSKYDQLLSLDCHVEQVGFIAAADSCYGDKSPSVPNAKLQEFHRLMKQAAITEGINREKNGNVLFLSGCNDAGEFGYAYLARSPQKNAVTDLYLDVYSKPYTSTTLTYRRINGNWYSFNDPTCW